MFGPIRIAPSILSANFLEIGHEIRMIADAGASYTHVDVMDGHFVPNITMGVPVVRQLASGTELPLDVHLMVSNPLDQLPWFIQAGADILTVHAETLSGQWVDRAIDMIHEGGAKASLAIKPHSSVKMLKPFIPQLDMVLIMSVEPGFSGQAYIEGSEAKIAAVAEMAAEAGRDDLLIEVDGGIGPATIERVCAAGADMIVCGNAVFSADDPAAVIGELSTLGEAAAKQGGRLS